MKKIFIIILLLTLTLNTKNVYASMAPITCNKNTYLQVGSTGEEVKKLQNELNIIMKCNLDIDGVIGSRTKRCILQFQAKNNLTTDGIVGPKTCKKLNNQYNNLNRKTYIVVTLNNTSVRSGPNNTSAIKSTMNRGQVLRVYDVVNINGSTWYKVYTQYTNVDDHYGYINANRTKSTAILVDISDQQLTYYYAGKILMSAPVITGKKGVYDTPVGNFILNPRNKKLTETISGINSSGSYYSLQANYWMPFITTKNIGFHNAPWRNIDDYTKTTYIKNGTQGNINMRNNDAERLYANTTESTYVIIKN